MEQTPYKTTINALYIALILSTILSFVPHSVPQMLSLALVAAVLIYAYAVRRRDAEDSLLHNHMTYLIGTVWMGTGFILLGSLICGAWVYSQGDNGVVQEVINRIESGWIPSEQDAMPYLERYIDANRALLVQASVIAIGPAVLYFAYRVAKGYSRAINGYRIANPKSWL